MTSSSTLWLLSGNVEWDRSVGFVLGRVIEDADCFQQQQAPHVVSQLLLLLTLLTLHWQ
jgi:hypothetical protein